MRRYEHSQSSWIWNVWFSPCCVSGDAGPGTLSQEIAFRSKFWHVWRKTWYVFLARVSIIFSTWSVTCLHIMHERFSDRKGDRFSILGWWWFLQRFLQRFVSLKHLFSKEQYCCCIRILEVSWTRTPIWTCATSLCGSQLYYNLERIL